VVHQAIAFWQRQRKTAYLQMLIAGGPRYDLDGNPHGEVTPEQQQQAREALVAWQANRQEKRRAASQQPRSSTSSERSTDGPPQDPPTATD
jgi:sRNA-binding protein